jgi:hypothetical protein
MGGGGTSKYVLIDCSSVQYFKHIVGDCHGRDHIVVRFTTTYAINAYHHQSCEFEPHSWRGVLDTTLCDKVCQWFSLSTPVSSTTKTNNCFSPQIIEQRKRKKYDDICRWISKL